MKKLVLSLICVAALVACKKEKVTGPEGPQGPAGSSTTPSGTISGKIEQMNQYMAIYSAGLNTTTVSLDGTSHTTVTDASGNYTLTNVQPGVYDLSMIKNGCGLAKRQQISFPGNGTLYVNSTITDKASFILTGGSVKDTLSQIKVNVNVTPYPQSRLAVVIFGNTNAVDINNVQSYDHVHIFYISNNVATDGSSIQFGDLSPTKFPSGSIVYAKVYPNNSSNSNYTDYANNKTVYTGCGTPLPTTFTLTMP